MKFRFDESLLEKTINVSTEADFLRGTVGDPQFHFRAPDNFKPGWFRFILKMTEPPGGASFIYFDMGHGFNEVEKIQLIRAGSSAIFKGLIYLPRKPIWVRLDPTDTNNRFQIKNFFAVKKPLPWVMIVGAKRIAGSLIKEPNRAGAMVVRGFKLLRGQEIAGARTSIPEKTLSPFDVWKENFDFDAKRDPTNYEHALKNGVAGTKVSVIMPVYNPEPGHLTAAIASVEKQIHQNWELCMVDDASTDPAIVKILQSAVKRDPRIRLYQRPHNGHISAASNSGLSMTTGDWIVPLDHDDLLRPHALAELVLASRDNPAADLIYSDEDKIDDQGERFDPHFKPDFSQDLLHSMNYFNHMSAYRTSVLKQLGGWRERYEGAQDYDLNLRFVEAVGPEAVHHIPRILYHWRAAEGSTARNIDQKNYAWEAGQKALQDHLTRTRLSGTVEPVNGTPFYHIRYDIAGAPPKVTLIIPTRDQIDLLRQAIVSIFEKTTYPNYDIIVVNNQSSDPETLGYFEQLNSSPLPVRVIDWDAPFNFSAINNHAVRQTSAEIVALVNNDVEVISPDWLTEMVALAQQDRVGCVGAKLLYPDHSIQHGGVIAGIGGVAGHAHKYWEAADFGYFGRLCVVHNVSAVTGACLLVRRDIYETVGGLDEGSLAVAFNDVDFCFKVMEAGYVNIWTPKAELIHHESKSRGQENTPDKQARFLSEVRVMQKRWSSIIERDPHYNPNLTLEHEDFSLRV